MRSCGDASQLGTNAVCNVLSDHWGQLSLPHWAFKRYEGVFEKFLLEIAGVSTTLAGSRQRKVKPLEGFFSNIYLFVTITRCPNDELRARAEV